MVQAARVADPEIIFFGYPAPIHLIEAAARLRARTALARAATICSRPLGVVSPVRPMADRSRAEIWATIALRSDRLRTSCGIKP